MSRLKVLFISHNHPSLHPGGSEILAYDLFQEMKRSGEVEAMFLACTNQVHRAQKPGTAFQTVGRSSDEIVLWAGHFDHFHLSQIDLHGIVPELSNLLRAFAPDVVHLHHSLLLGVEMLFLIRRVLPRARIVFTLHDYYAICANHGQMVKAGSHELCRAASPDACGKCFPEIGHDKFVLRRSHLRAMFSQVDRFISPSEFLRRRYVDWGLDGERIEVVRNGRPAVPATPHRPAGGPRDRFAYFGNLSPFKGVLVALAAMRLLRAGGRRDLRLDIHGGSPFQSAAFTAEFADEVRAAGPAVHHHGPYQAADVPRLMADADWVIVPSIWWENAPLVIQEAFQQRRPVICSDIGGMAEAVQDGISGLHFRAGDPASLAEAMRRAVDEDALWARLVEGIPHVPTMREVAAAHLEVYRGERRPARARSAKASRRSA